MSDALGFANGYMWLRSVFCRMHGFCEVSSVSYFRSCVEFYGEVNCNALSDMRENNSQNTEGRNEERGASTLDQRLVSWKM